MANSKEGTVMSLLPPAIDELGTSSGFTLFLQDRANQGEAALLATGLLESVRVKGIPSQDTERVEEISASVRLSGNATLDQLKQAATSRLANWELPRHWEVD